MIKNMLFERIPDKIFGRKLSNQVKLERKKKNVVSVFACFFNCYSKRLSCSKETRH